MNCRAPLGQTRPRSVERVPRPLEIIDRRAAGASPGADLSAGSKRSVGPASVPRICSSIRIVFLSVRVRRPKVSEMGLEDEFGQGGVARNRR